MANDKGLKRRYFTRIGISMAIYLASLFAANYLIEDMQVGRQIAFVLALIPGLAAAGLFYAVGMFIVEQSDEFMRMLAVRQQLIATGFAMSVATVWGFLEELLLFPHFPGFWIVVLWAIGTVVGGLSNRITHGTWGNCW